MNIRITLLCLIFTFSLTALKAQEEDILKLDSTQISESEIFVKVEEMPNFPGGKGGLIEFYKQSSSYKICSTNENDCETLYYQIIIDTKGNVGDFKIIKGINKEIDAETARIVKQMPKWNPGKKDSQFVNVLLTLSIKYKVN